MKIKNKINQMGLNNKQKIITFTEELIYRLDNNCLNHEDRKALSMMLKKSVKQMKGVK